MKQTCQIIFILSLIISILCCVALPSYDKPSSDDDANYEENQPSSDGEFFITLTSIESVCDLSFEKGHSIIIRATIYPYDEGTEITWTASNTSVATISILNDFGSVRIFGQSVGSVYIYAHTSNGLSAKLYITIYEYESEIEPTSISLNYESYSLKIGESITLEASIYPTNATLQTLSWSSENRYVADISIDGESCVITGISAGWARIKVRTKNGCIAYCDVMVIDSHY